MHGEKHLIIKTDSGENEFQVRFLKDEGVGLITTRSDKNYLILDSLDFWYDLIQNQYPKKKKCSCKNEWFKIQFCCIPRQNTNDFREITVFTTCTRCNKKSKSLTLDIDYSPTDELLKKPITYCEKPKLKYKFKELTCYWSGDDIKDFLNYMFNDLNLNVYCWFFKHPENIRRFEKVTLNQAIQIITTNHRYLDFFFTQNEIDTSKMIKLINEKGVCLHQDIWRRNEIIQLSSPIVMVGYGQLYLIHFCNQYLEKGEVKDKSKSFAEISLNLIDWLKMKFITRRGINCFDGEAAYNKYISGGDGHLKLKTF